MEKSYNTLSDFLNDSESEEEIYFAYSATLRIFGEISDINAISTKLGILPTHIHRQGDKAGPNSPGYPHDMWTYKAPIDESDPVEEHIDFLWAKIKPCKNYLIDLKQYLKVDVFLGYRSNCDCAGIEISHKSLEIFTELNIPFSMSIIIV